MDTQNTPKLAEITQGSYVKIKKGVMTEEETAIPEEDIKHLENNLCIISDIELDATPTYLCKIVNDPKINWWLYDSDIEMVITPEEYPEYFI